MATERQIQANRRNAKRSTGPRTRKGKAIASRNALSHGLLAQAVVLDDEDMQLYQQRAEAIRAHFDPVGAMEEELVERVIVCLWRLRRGAQIEGSIFQYHALDYQLERARARARAFTKVSQPLSEEPWMASLAMPPSVEREEITDERAYAAASKEAAQAEAGRDRERLAIAFTAAATQNDLLGKVHRYEITIERSLYRALEQLDRLQAARVDRGGPGVPPIIDVTQATSTN